MSEWIEYEKQKPTVGCEYHLLFKDGTTNRGWWFGGSEVFGKNEFHMFLNEMITHWAKVQVEEQPIPRLPEGVSRGQI